MCCNASAGYNPGMIPNTPETDAPPATASPVQAMARLDATVSLNPQVLFAVLVGSRASGRAAESSDWDIAVLWQQMDALARISRHEYLRRELASALGVTDDKIDLIDLSSAGLAMRALATEEGILIVANDERAWRKFQERTWREIEDFHWERDHAA